MADPCTPSTEHVRAVYAGQHGAILADEHGREFDRWLAEHDRERMTPMTDTNWDELPWIERATIVATESLWRDAGTRLTYAAESARNPADTRVSSRTLTHYEGRVQGRHADLGEVSSDGTTVTTRVSTPKVASRWVDEPR
ncbi:hypothetical protein [Curtobacterium sp. UCD-KPL2560]|uniref:hypothetical protein n=1 Tax=Curtobacterium sp. UCD-KPL2560 TaxID=1885315 RepID=UPI0008260554|nr:hypothetical protein [Curtobacterium sp. UCD-KPL2560]